MTRPDTGVLVLGIGGHAVALDPQAGTELWRTKLKASSFVTVHVVGALVFAGAGGEVFCLDARSGDILWRNKLEGLGYGLVAFSGTGDAATAAAEQAEALAAVTTTA